MPSIKELSNSKSKRFAGRKGFGTRLFLKKLNFDDDGNQIVQVVPEEDSQLFGIRDFRGPNIVTNPVVLSHNQLPGGFVHTVPGLRDSGSMEFEANFFPWALGWQREGASGFMSSIGESPMDDEESMLEGLLVLPTRRGNCYYFQGYASMMGPITYPQENVISSPFGVKISGKPYEMTPIIVNPNNDNTSIINISTVDFTGAIEAGNYYMARIIVPGKYDAWSLPVANGVFGTEDNWPEAASLETIENADRYIAMIYACPWLNS